MSDSTKKALANALNDVLEKKPLDKITITDLTDACGVNRQTFYYHFHDIYELVEWMYLGAANYAIGQNKTYTNWQDGMLSMCNMMLENKSFILRTYHSRAKDHLEEILVDLSYELLMNVVKEYSANYSISLENAKFIANFYKYAFAGVILEWVKNEMKGDPKTMIKRVGKLMKGTFLDAVKKFDVTDDDFKSY